MNSGFQTQTSELGQANGQESTQIFQKHSRGLERWICAEQNVKLGSLVARRSLLVSTRKHSPLHARVPLGFIGSRDDDGADLWLTGAGRIFGGSAAQAQALFESAELLFFSGLDIWPGSAGKPMLKDPLHELALHLFIFPQESLGMVAFEPHSFLPQLQNILEQADAPPSAMPWMLCQSNLEPIEEAPCREPSSKGSCEPLSLAVWRHLLPPHPMRPSRDEDPAFAAMRALAERAEMDSSLPIGHYPRSVHRLRM